MLQRAVNHQVVPPVCLIPLLSCSNAFHVSSGPEVWTQFPIHGLDPPKLCNEIHTDYAMTELGFLGPFVTENQSSHHACVQWLGHFKGSVLQGKNIQVLLKWLHRRGIYHKSPAWSMTNQDGV